jgi:UDP-N-acetylglucosamine 3-dehydrogenase
VERKDETEIPRNDKKEPLLLEIQNFIGAIEGKNDSLVSAQQAVNVTKIAEAALLSSQKGVPIYLDLK